MKNVLISVLVLSLVWLLERAVGNDIGPVDTWRMHQRLAAQPMEPPDPSLLIVGIDDAVFAANRFNRLEHARLIDKLTHAGVRCIFFDVLFDEPRGPQFDLPLAEAIERSRRVVVAGAYRRSTDGDSESFIRPTFFPELQELVRRGHCRLGLVNTATSGEKQRTLVAFVDPSTDPDINPFGAGVQLSAAATVYSMTQHLGPADIELFPSLPWRSAQLKISPLTLDVRSDLQGSGLREAEGRVESFTIPVRYRPPATGPSGRPGERGRIPVVSYLTLADGTPEELRALENKIVLIGDTTRSDTDLLQTPLGRMKGVEIHAQILDSLLRGEVPRFADAGSWSGYAARASIALLCWVFFLVVRRQPGLIRTGLIYLLFVAVWQGLVQLVDRTGHLWPEVLGHVTLAAALLLALLIRFLASARVLKTFIPAEIVDQLLRGDQIHQGTVEATVMVTDIRGYTTLSESRTPLQVLALLNDYHTETVSLYRRHGGHVLNYQGDAQIILFGHPKKLKDAPFQAVKAAQAASGAVDKLRKRWNLPPGQQFFVGAGICTGRVVIADLGSEQREYTVIGETVRKGHKLQSQSQVLGANIILDEETYQACVQKPEVEKRENVVIDGLPEPVTVYITDLLPPA